MTLDTSLIALICGHFLGDFVFQSDKLAKEKTEKKSVIIWHALQVAIITWTLLGNFYLWWIAGIIFVSHLLIDSIKTLFISKAQTTNLEDNLERKEKLNRFEFISFVTDQVLHVLVLFIIWYLVNKLSPVVFQKNIWVAILGIQYKKGLILLTGLAIGVWGVGIVLKYQMNNFTIRLSELLQDGLPKGGKVIGILERLLVFMFVLIGKPEGIGFVIAAKAVFRIGDLTNKEERNQAEYIMIGSLRSFTYAFIVAFIVKWLINSNILF